MALQMDHRSSLATGWYLALAGQVVVIASASAALVAALAADDRFSINSGCFWRSHISPLSTRPGQRLWRCWRPRPGCRPSQHLGNPYTGRPGVVKASLNWCAGAKRYGLDADSVVGDFENAKERSLSFGSSFDFQPPPSRKRIFRWRWQSKRQRLGELRRPCRYHS